MTVTLRQMSYFAALAEARNFGLAAARMNISQPALSMQIKEMEAALGGPLVERLPRDVRLTRRGEALLVRIRDILARTRELEAEARLGAPAPRVSVGLIPTVAPYLLPPLLAGMDLAQGIAGLRLREAVTGTLLDELDGGQLDAVMIASDPGRAGLVAEPLFTERFFLAGRAERLARIAGRSDGLRPNALDPDDLLLLDEGHCLADQALEVCGLDRRQPRVDLGASSLSTLCGLAAADYGLTFLPEIALAAERRAAPGLSAMRFSAPEPRRTLHLVRRAATMAEPWFPALAARIEAEGRRLIDQAAACTDAVPPGDPPDTTVMPAMRL